MRISRRAGSDAVDVELDAREQQLLRWALERASFIDTPASEQPAIQNFCGRLLEALAAPSR